jgi:cell division protein FtsA
VVVLDVGTRKMCCLVARLLPWPYRQAAPDPIARIQVIGHGYQLSRGIGGGRVVDMEAAERTIRSVVAKAERAADVTVNEVYLTASFGPLHSQSFTASVDLPAGAVTGRDMDRVMRAAKEYASQSSKTVLHAVPTGYTLGYENGIVDPLGMIGDALKVDMHTVSADALPLRNLRHCVQRSHLSVAGVAASSFVSGLAVMADGEAEAGVTCIDMGAGTTGVSVFAGGSLIFCDSVDIGGNHITSDIAKAFSVPTVEAERLKTLYASVFAAGNGMRLETITDEGERGTELLSRHISKAELSEIARIRLEQIFAEVRDRLRVSGVAPMSGHRLVLTGGASELVGAAELAAQMLGKQPRLGRPRPISGLPGREVGPAFAAPAGLLIHLLDDDLRGDVRLKPEIIATSQSYLARVGQWLRESF